MRHLRTARWFALGGALAGVGCGAEIGAPVDTDDFSKPVVRRVDSPAPTWLRDVERRRGRVLVREPGHAIVSGSRFLMPRGAREPVEADWVRRLVRVGLEDPQIRAAAGAVGVDLLEETGAEALVGLFDYQVDDLRNAGAAPREIARDARQAVSVAAPDAGLYHTYDEITSELQALAAANPTITQLTSFGTSLEGRTLWVLKISDNPTVDEAEHEVFFEGLHHAREWIAADVPHLLAQHLVSSYATSPQVKALVDNAEIFVAPMINPDGHQYSVSSYRLWRKNRRNNGNGIFGVDINRNYAFQWVGSGSSSDPSSEVYRGPSAASEPETQALQTFIAARKPRAMISYHNYSQLVLYPWGYTYNDVPEPDRIIFSQLATGMATDIRNVHGKIYTPQPGSDLYLVNGEACDWAWGVHQIRCFTIELRPVSSSPGFELPETEIQPTFQENLPAALSLIRWTINLDTVVGTATKVLGLEGEDFWGLTAQDGSRYRPRALPAENQVEGQAVRFRGQTVGPDIFQWGTAIDLVTIEKL